MYVYEGKITKLESGKFYAVILKTSGDEPCSDTVKESQPLDSIQDANIWVDDEIARLSTGKGVWE